MIINRHEVAPHKVDANEDLAAALSGFKATPSDENRVEITLAQDACVDRFGGILDIALAENETASHAGKIAVVAAAIEAERRKRSTLLASALSSELDFPSSPRRSIIHAALALQQLCPEQGHAGNDRFSLFAQGVETYTEQLLADITAVTEPTERP